MKMQIQNLIIKFVSENPQSQISAVRNALPDIDRSSISSALTRLTQQGKFTREQNDDGRFEYTLASGEIVPEVTAAAVSKVPQQEFISPTEWERRFKAAESLLKSGLTRRANQAFLELLDVTRAQRLREKVIKSRNRCGSRPSGDDSKLAGIFVGNY